MKKLENASPIRLEFQFESHQTLIEFRDAYFKLCKIANMPMGEITLDEKTFKATFKGRMDNLCNIFYIIGALAERSAVKHNMFQLN